MNLKELVKELKNQLPENTNIMEITVGFRVTLEGRIQIIEDIGPSTPKVTIKIGS